MFAIIEVSRFALVCSRKAIFVCEVHHRSDATPIGSLLSEYSGVPLYLCFSIRQVGVHVFWVLILSCSVVVECTVVSKK